MPDSWQQINNDGVLMDWTSEDTIKLCDIYHALETIKRALKERIKAAYLNYWFSTLNSIAYPQYETLFFGEIFDDSYDIRQKPINTIIDNLEYAKNFLINADFNRHSYRENGMFVNHTADQTLVNYTKLIYWNNNTVLNEIGDSSLIIPSLLIDKSPWLAQSYKIINLMRQVEGRVIYRNRYKSTYGTYANWSSLLSAFNGNPWEWYGTGWLSLVAASDPGGSNNAITEYSPSELWFGVIGNPSDIYQINYDDIAASCDMYFTPYETSSFWDDRYGYDKTVKNIIHMFDEKNFNPKDLLSNKVIIHDPIYEPTNNDYGFKFSSTQLINNGSAIFKFDGPNGFKFRGEDW